MPSLDTRLEQLEQKEQQEEQTDISPLELCEFLGTLPFWCGDDELHKRDPDYQHKARCCTTHIVGLPRHPATNEEMPLTPFQIEFVIYILRNKYDLIHNKKLVEEALKELLRIYHFYHINKGRQMGFTEIILRLIQFLCFSLYAGSNIGIIAATNGSLARKDLRRLARLFKPISNVVAQWIKSTKEGVCLKLVNDTTIWAYAASEEAITGDTQYKCIFMDEAAKWSLQNDTPVFNSIQPIVEASGGDLFLVSTPKGPVKTFYDITQTENDYERLQYDIWRTEGNLYTKEEIERKLANSIGDPEQEYLCKFKVGKDSIFGTVSAEDQQGKSEWRIDDDSEEEDNYDEEKDEEGIMWHEKK